MTIHISKVGVRFARLVALEEHGRSPGGAVLYRCRCDCGNETITEVGKLVRGQAKSCGCYARDRSTKHGHSRGNGGRTPEYASWRNMLSRCCNPNVGRYPDYGGRGITVCERWRKFENFLSDMGPMPTGHSIERRDNNGNYEPSNCFWLPRNQQSKNRRGNRMVVVRGAQCCFAEACRILGISHSAAERRIYEHGLSPQEAVDEAALRQERKVA